MRLGAQGRIVLPPTLRYRLGLSPGDELTVEERRDGVLLRPVGKTRALLLKMRSRWRKLGVTMDSLFDERRREAEREAKDAR